MKAFKITQFIIWVYGSEDKKRERDVLLFSTVLCGDDINHRVCLHLCDGWPEKRKAVYMTFDLYLHTESKKLYLDRILFQFPLHSYYPLKERQVFLWLCKNCDMLF